MAGWGVYRKPCKTSDILPRYNLDVERLPRLLECISKLIGRLCTESLDKDTLSAEEDFEPETILD